MRFLAYLLGLVSAFVIGLALMCQRYEDSELWKLVTEYWDLKGMYGSDHYDEFPDAVQDTIRNRYYYLVDEVGGYADRAQVDTPEEFVKQLRFNMKHGISSLPEWVEKRKKG